MLPQPIPDSFLVIPSSVGVLLLVGLLAAGFMQFRQGYIGRIGIFCNGLIIGETLCPHWQLIPDWAQIYVYIALVLGIIALISYIFKKSLPQEFYQICLVAFGSASIIIVLFLLASQNIPLFQ